MARTSGSSLHIHTPRMHTVRDVALVAALLVGIAAFIETIRF